MMATLRIFVPMSLLVGALAAQQPSAGGETVRPSPISQTELVRRLSDSVDSLTKSGQYSGVVLLARNGAPVFQRAYGLADRAGIRATHSQTVFILPTINKIFTQIAIL